MLGTARNQVVFQVEPDDARLLEPRFAPSLSATDLTGLAAYEVAMRLVADNQVLAPTTGLTLPLPEALRDPAALREQSRERYGMPRADIEAALAARLRTGADGVPTGRRRRGGQP